MLDSRTSGVRILSEDLCGEGVVLLKERESHSSRE